MPGNAKFHFIEGPSLRALPDRSQRRRIRSQVIKKAIRDRNFREVDHGIVDARPDVFVSMNQDELEQYESFHYCTSELWPEFRPGEYAVDFARHWVQRAHNNPAVMAAILFSSTMHRDARRPMNRSQRLRQLRLKDMAVQSLRRNLDGPLDDATIYTILCLATTPNEVEPPPADFNPFKAELVDLQWVSLYTRMTFDPTHSAAVLALIGRIGGIDKLREYSVAWLVFFACLMGAANSLSIPAFTPVTLDGDLAESSLENAGAFIMFDTLSLPDKIVRTLCSVTRLSQSINEYLEGGQLDLDERAMVVHNVLSLPMLKDEPEPLSHWVLDLYDCARVGVQLFTLHVIFPIARTADIRRQLLPVMRMALARLSGLRGSLREEQLVLWSCVVASIAADVDDALESAWFIGRLGGLLRGGPVKSMSQLKGVLSCFAWVDKVCDEAALGVIRACMRDDFDES